MSCRLCEVKDSFVPGINLTKTDKRKIREADFFLRWGGGMRRRIGPTNYIFTKRFLVGTFFPKRGIIANFSVRAASRQWCIL